MIVRFCRVTADVVLPLRHAVLRTGRRWADAHYRQDDDPRSAHFAALEATTLDDATVFAVGSVLPEKPEWHEGDTGAWRVRGMATRGDLRGSGFGGRVLASLLQHVSSEGGGLVWCTARLGALAFYERAGFVAFGGQEHVAGIGPHRTMRREIEPAPRSAAGL